MKQFTTKLTINVHSYRDAKRFKHVDHIPNLTSCQVLNDKNEIIHEINFGTHDKRSSFEKELDSILQAITQHLSILSGNNIEICSSERSMPKLIKRFNDVFEYLRSTDGQVVFETLMINDFVEHLIYEQFLFDPRIKSIDLIKLYLTKLIPIINSHVISPIYIKCDSNFEYYYSYEKFNKLPEFKNKIGYLYLVKMFNDTEKFFKIGITQSGVKQRFSNFKTYQLEVIFEKKMTIYEAFCIEQDIISFKKQLKYIPLIEFSGMYECFNLIQE